MYKIKIPDLEYYKNLIPCRSTCPVNTDACGYIAAAGAGNFELAYAIARQPNPFVDVCGRVCASPCEDACRRGLIDEPVAIRPIKRAACEHHDQAFGHLPFLLEKKDVGKGRKIAILGAGPAGLSAAHDLARMGYSVTIFESRSVPGGMLYLGIPEYRLPRGLIRYEVAAILELGVELKNNTMVGENLTLNDIKSEGFEAIFVSVGCHKGRNLDIEGRDLDGALSAVDYLLNINLGYRVDLGERVAIIGGGDVAMDVARTATRSRSTEQKISQNLLKELQVQKVELSSDSLEIMRAAVDVARTAIRGSSRDVHLFCLESQDEMPAHDFEIEEALVEGIALHPRRSPQRVVGENGKVAGLVTVGVASVFDFEGKFAPVIIPDSEVFTPVDSVVFAVGQSPELSFISPDDGIEISRQGTIVVDPDTLMTTATGVFAGGDSAFGPRLIIDAVSHGKKAAAGIHRYLSGSTIGSREHGRMRTIENHKMPFQYLGTGRHDIPSTPSNRRTGFTEVETGYDKETATREAQRCLRCEINTIFDSEKCVLCGGCVDVCPYYCLQIVTVDKLSLDDDGRQLAEKMFGMPWSEIEAEGESLGGAIIKNEDQCVRCGLCSRRCPHSAITMELFEFEEEIYVKEQTDNG